MGLVTVPTALLPHQLRQYMKKLDDLGSVYHFTVSVINDRIDLEMVTDSGDPGVTVQLHSVGSWTAEGTLIVGTRD